MKKIRIIYLRYSAILLAVLSYGESYHSTDRAVRVVEMALELMGNHGTLHDSGVEKIYRDARLTQIFEGTNQINRLAVIEDQQEQFLARIERN